MTMDQDIFGIFLVCGFIGDNAHDYDDDQKGWLRMS